LPTGNGIRIDTHLVNGHPSIVSADFDSLIAKLIVTASSWRSAVRKAQRALSDTQIAGVKTNIHMLRAIVAHPDFLAGKCDTQWLETLQRDLLHQSSILTSSSLSTTNTLVSSTASSSTAPTLSSATNTLFRKGDAWSIAISSPDTTTNTNTNTKNKTDTPPHHLEITRIHRNDFPTSLTADLLFTSPPTTPSATPLSTPYTITLSATSASASASTSLHRRGNPSDASHISIPFPGKLVEVLVDEGDVVKEGDVVCVVQQMKMELEVRTPRSGRVVWVMEAEDGEDVAEGMLAVVVESEKDARL
jgi:acetyl/propionyl-CoA carboxylase alpha subunit